MTARTRSSVSDRTASVRSAPTSKGGRPGTVWGKKGREEEKRREEMKGGEERRQMRRN